MSSFAIKWSPIVFGFALFLGSALLFLIQPVVGRMLMPHLGGNPIAWKVCLAFFQAMLLAGYLLADLLHRPRGLRWQPWLQILLMGIAITFLFLGIFGDSTLRDLAPRLTSFDTSPILSTLSLLVVVIGLPMATLSAVGPLVHRWFAHLDHPKASDPYYLFVPSSLGGLAALIAYPIFIEPYTPFAAQWLSWKLALAALGVMVGLAALCVWRSPRNPELEPPEKPTDPNAPLVAQLIGRGPATRPRRLRWFIAAALPIGLMMGLTDYLTLDLAPTPVLWAIPIALYLFAFAQAFARFSIYAKGSFVVKLVVQLIFGSCLCFALAMVVVALMNLHHRGDTDNAALTALCVVLFGMVLLVPSSWLMVLQPISVLIVIFVHVNPFKDATLFLPTILLHLVGYYFTIRLCFDVLAEDRPAVSALTSYYCWIGLGGLGGGTFQQFIAPLVFRSGYLEYPLFAALACTLRPAWLMNGLTDWLVCRPRLLKNNQSTDLAPWCAKVALAFDLALPVLVTMAAVGFFLLRPPLTELNVRPNEHFVITELRSLLMDVPLVLALFAAALLIARPLRFGLALAGVVTFCWIGQHRIPGEAILAQQRTPFGVLRVTEHTSEDMEQLTQRMLTQGTAMHGSCITEPASFLRHPTEHYHRKGPVGQVMRNLEWFRRPLDELRNPPHGFWNDKNRDNADDDARIAASLIGLGACGGFTPIAAGWSEPAYAFVGLGAGSLFTYAHPYQWVDAYELDPAIRVFSEADPPMFHYFQSARQRGVNANVIPGDGRRSLTQPGHEGFYHVLFVDALNSHAMPTHLLTKEALETYFHKLVPDGVVCIRTSNPYVEPPRVLGQITQRLDLAMAVLRMNAEPGPDLGTYMPSEWVVIARNKEVMHKWTEVGGFEVANNNFINRFRFRDPRQLTWTDEHANVFAAMRDEHSFPHFLRGSLGLLLAFAFIMGIIEIIVNNAASAKAEKPARGTKSIVK
jgi:hypothetical protein